MTLPLYIDKNMFEDLIDEIMYALQNNKKKVFLVVLWVLVFWSAFWYLYKTYMHEPITEVIQEKIIKKITKKVEKTWEEKAIEAKTTEKNQFADKKNISEPINVNTQETTNITKQNSNINKVSATPNDEKDEIKKIEEKIEKETEEETVEEDIIEEEIEKEKKKIELDDEEYFSYIEPDYDIENQDDDLDWTNDWDWTDDWDSTYDWDWTNDWASTNNS